MMYYLLDRSWAEHPARLPDRGSYDRQGAWWNNGQRFTKPIKTPIEMRLRPYRKGSPDERPLMPAMFKDVVPLYRDDLVAALQSFGVDNLELYPARILDPDNGQYYENYKAVNIIGMVAAADMQKSVWSAPDGIPLVDVAFDKLVIDPNKARDLLFFRLAENNDAVMVHERLRDHLIKSGFTELEFHNPEHVAL
jgi:hypothetical protein